MRYRDATPNNLSEKEQENYLKILYKAYAVLVGISIFLTIALVVKHAIFGAII